MEKLSRVRKYEDLRKQIENETVGTSELPQEKMQDYAERLSEIDPSIFKKVNISEEASYTPERERKATGGYETESTMSDFRNEYLDDFINEVREYNIKKGNRENENTQIDILNQLNAVSRAKRSDYVQNIADEVVEPQVENTMSMSKEQIAQEVQNLLQEEPVPAFEEAAPVFQEAEPIVPPMMEPEQQEDTGEIQAMISTAATGYTQSHPIQSGEATDVLPFGPRASITAASAARVQAKKQEQEKQREQMQEVNKTQMLQSAKKNTFIGRKAKANVVPTREEQMEIEREQRLQQKLVEETQQLRVQLNEYEDDLNDLSEGVEKTNKMLNIILGCLILALLVIIGIIVFWIVQAGGLV